MRSGDEDRFPFPEPEKPELKHMDLFDNVKRADPPKGYDPHEPPACAAWDPTCHTWVAVDRDNTLVSNWHNPEDPEDYSRITTKTSFKDFDKLCLSRMRDSEKKEIYAKYKSDPETYTVARLATVYGLNQPRVQAILLLEAWEEQERELGLVTPEDDKLEELVHEAHMRAIKELEIQEDIKIKTDKYSSRMQPPTRGPTGRFRTLREEEAVPEMPDLDYHVKRSEVEHERRKQEYAAQAEKHKRVPNKRWTFIIKDTSEPNIR